MQRESARRAEIERMRVRLEPSRHLGAQSSAVRCAAELQQPVHDIFGGSVRREEKGDGIDRCTELAQAACEMNEQRPVARRGEEMMDHARVPDEHAEGKEEHVAIQREEPAPRDLKKSGGRVVTAAATAVARGIGGGGGAAVTAVAQDGTRRRRLEPAAEAQPIAASSGAAANANRGGGGGGGGIGGVGAWQRRSWAACGKCVSTCLSSAKSRATARSPSLGSEARTRPVSRRPDVMGAGRQAAMPSWSASATWVPRAAREEKAEEEAEEEGEKVARWALAEAKGRPVSF